MTPCIHQNHVFAVRPNQSKVLTEFLQLVLESQFARTYFITTAKQTTNLACTNRTTLGQFRFPLPKVNVQGSIWRSVKAGLEPVEGRVECAEREIELIRGYRTRLVSDVVTGKLDVRDVARSLPESVGNESIDVMTTPDADFDAQADGDVLDERDSERAEEAV